MRWFWVALLLPWGSSAQTTPLVSGVLLERDGPGASGELAVRAAGDEVFRFRFDAATKVERDGAESDIAALQPGDRVEVVPDRMPQADLRYAVSLRATAAPPRPAVFLYRRPDAAPVELPLPQATVSYSGVVSQISPASVILHLRGGASQPILLVRQTRFTDNGISVDAGALKTNMYVFVRAGRTIYGDVEAYQVVWGQILQPK